MDVTKTEEAALAEFMEYFRKNYPGPETIIGKPDWHSPKIFRAARHALFTPTALAPDTGVKALAELRARAEKLHHQITEASDPDFIWGALDNVHDMGVTLDDYAAAVSRAIRAALDEDTRHG